MKPTEQGRKTPIFSVITPSRGDRPRALAGALASVETAVDAARGVLAPGMVEVLVGFDGVKPPRPETWLRARFYDFPKTGNYGHQIRDWLIRQAKGSHLLFLDDDNAFTPVALTVFAAHLDHDMIVARMHAALAFGDDYLPRDDDLDACLVQGNIDALCVCLSRELVLVRCGGWETKGGYQADFANLVRYYRRARSPVKVDGAVGIYDAFRGIDVDGLNFRQQKLPRRKIVDCRQDFEPVAVPV